ncbi:peroxidase 66 [Silene latifolia]|uniref:peroxidase 66 n=1 Tax=Silene latifolia TaxID=37657 RepID=UPI003D7737B0
MAKLLQKHHSFLSLMFIAISVLQAKGRLHSDYYDETCPQAEKIIADAVFYATMHDYKVPPRLIRLFFHDCFITGCDASLLLDSTQKQTAEKDSPANLSVRAYYVIDNAKAKLEEVCPKTVSCADIIAIAARDAVHLSGGPYWKVLKGRKDGRRSNAFDTIDLPRPSTNVTELIHSFSERRLNTKDLVALAGAHSLGSAHCASFQSRLRHFSHKYDIDPTMDIWFAHILRMRCPKHNEDHNAGHSLDSTSKIFDNDYYKRLMVGKGILSSDQALYNDHRTKYLVESYAKYTDLFFTDFATSMIKLGNNGVNHHGEVRRHCRSVN